MSAVDAFLTEAEEALADSAETQKTMRGLLPAKHVTVLDRLKKG